jgi:hypothetical protein
MPATAELPPSALPAPGRLRSLRKAAEEYGLNPYTIRRWIRDRLISSYQVGPKLVMVDLDEINARLVRQISSAREAGQ